VDQVGKGCSRRGASRLAKSALAMRPGGGSSQRADRRDDGSQVFKRLTYSTERHSAGGELLLQMGPPKAAPMSVRAQTARETSVSHNARAGTLPDPSEPADTAGLPYLVRGLCARPGLPWRPLSRFPLSDLYGRGGDPERSEGRVRSPILFPGPGGPNTVCARKRPTDRPWSPAPRQV